MAYFSFSRNLLNVAALALFAVACFAFWHAGRYWGQENRTAPPSGFTQIMEGRGAFFPVLSLRDSEGLDFNLASHLQGRLAVVNLWATWCPPCLREIPSLQSLAKGMPSDRFVVALVSADLPADAADLKKKMEKTGLSSVNTSYLTDFAQMEALSAGGLPVTYIVGQQGQILYRINGEADWNDPEIRNWLKTLLEKRNFP